VRLPDIMRRHDGANGTMSSTDVDDLTLARQALLGSGLSLVVAKNGKLLFKTKSHGVSDLLTMIRDLGQLTEGASLADSIVGRAAALLCVYSKIVAVYGETMSKGGASVLEEKGIRYKFGKCVPKILNRRKDDICPFDKAVSGIQDPTLALERLKSIKLN